jgi:tetratricopeptide (TPR) repeat protein
MAHSRFLWIPLAVFLMCLSTILPSQSISLRLSPGVEIPLAESASFFSTGGVISLGGQYAFGGSLPIFALAGMEYSLEPIKAANFVQSMSGSLGAGVDFEVLPRLSLQAHVSGGYYYSMMSVGGSLQGGGNPLAQAGIGFRYMLSPSIDLGAGVAYQNLIGLYNGLQIFFGTSLFLSGNTARKARIEAPPPGRPDLLRARTPDPDKGIAVQQLSLDPVFPVFRNYYDDHPIGKVVLLNQEKGPIVDIKVSLFIKRYMDTPRPLAVPPTLAPGERTEIDLFALFNSGVMDITEGDKATAELLLEYKVKDDRYADTRTRTIVFYNRNAMTWEDDRRAAAFVTRFDPLIQEYAKNVLSIVDGMGSEAVNRKLLAGVAVHQTLQLAGLKYSVDPKSAYADKSNQKLDIDYLQFPRQTLQRKAGDCDDLAILYCALLEALGIDTAFVTVPNHILMAFALDIDPADIGRTFSNSGDLFVRNGVVWLPVEVTERTGGLMKAWRAGAQEWRQHESANALGFYPLGEAWKVYAPVQSPDSGGQSAASSDLPPARDIAAAVRKEILAFKQVEVDAQVAALQKQMDAKRGNPPIQNRIGILYARYGFMEQAEAEFRKLTASEKTPYVPALINLGNLRFLKENYQEALDLYARAARLEPANVAASLGVARASFALEKYQEAKDAFAKVRLADPQLADRFAFLEQREVGGSRATNISALKGVVIWGE